MKIQINDLNLVTFDKEKHVSIYKELVSEDPHTSYVKEIDKRLLLGKPDIKEFSFNHAYLVEFHNQIVGYVYFTDVRKNQFYFEYLVLKSYRHHGLGKYILGSITNYVFENYNNIKQINLDIDPSNIASMQTALVAGYDVNDEFDKNTSLNNKQFTCDNPYYLNKNIHGNVR